ncbi:MAG: hypothetical protein IJ534_02610, partial [Bacteroidaceae bacterium]|nr:hypothetical protein [Bacteroidaceae bacterium]
EYGFIQSKSLFENGVFLQYGKPQEDTAISMDSINAVHTFDKFQLFILNHFHMTHYSYMLTAILCLIAFISS